MKYWIAEFTGRKRLADGVMYPIKTITVGDTEELARLKLYDAFDHVMSLKLEKTNPPADGVKILTEL